jgi:hypothetical protein
VIVEWLFNAFKGALDALMSHLPSMPDLSSYGSTTGIGPIVHLFGYLDWYVPVVPAIALLGVLLASWVGVQVLRATEWVLTKIHLLGGSS